MTTQGEVFPLGISGLVSVPRNRISIDCATTGTSQFLFTDEERLSWLARRLERQLDFPVIAPGSGVIARQILQRFPTDLGPEFAKKLLLTVRDGEMHSMLMISGKDKPVAVCFVCWRGSPRDLVATRYGGYLDGFFNWIGRLNQSDIRPLAFLQIDAFIQEEVDAAEPFRLLNDCVILDVEYTYLPGYFFGQQQADDTVPKAVVINLDLLSDEQKGQLAPLIAR
ncbi:MAG: hypothetical protein MRJ68_02735 [Nitrospira sp.]|nr:hypothetical protein [Nitrospira sp.]